MFTRTNKWGQDVEYNYWSPKQDNKHLFSEYCIESSLHGLRYIGQSKRHFVEKIFWMIAFCVGVSVSILFISQVWGKYQTTPVITVFQPSQTTIDRITFPAITICNTNNVIKSIAEEYMRRVEETPESKDALTDLHLMDHICRTSTTFSESFNFSLEHGNIRSEVREELEKYKKLNPNVFRNKTKKVTDALRDVSQKCDAMILLCMWNDQIQNCSELFVEIETDFGYCCVFNMVPQSLLFRLRNDDHDNESVVKQWAASDLDTDKLVDADQPEVVNFEAKDDKIVQNKYPYRQHRAGKTTGLSVLLDPDLDSYFCANTDSQGFMALAHLPLDFPNIADEGVAIKPNTETYLKIRPEIILADDGIKEFALEKRKCYFGKEYSLKYFEFYTTANCENECIANITFKECGCIRYFMPRDETQRICGAKRFNCSEVVRKRLLQDGLNKHCRMCRGTCTDIEFQMTTSYLPLRHDVPLWEYQNGTNALWTHKNVSLLHIHYAVSSTYPKLRKELYGFVDLLSNTGGILGLCLGFSVLSLLEILYFVTLRLYCQTKKGKKLGHKMTNATKKLWDKVSRSVSFTKNVANGKQAMHESMGNQKKDDMKINKISQWPYYFEKQNFEIIWMIRKLF